jgi:tripartite-type tricarboxylate transporter receptor subunit TctC
VEANGLARRRVLRRLSAAAALGLIQLPISLRSVAAQGRCPEIAGRTLRWIVPYSPGGGYDAYTRLVQPFFEAQLGVRILVSNVAGAGGIVGAKAIAGAAPDGRTLGIINAPGLLTTKLSGVDAPDPASAFTILGRIANIQHVWVTSGSSSLQSIEDVFAKAETDPILFALTDLGGTPFISAAVGAELLGIEAAFLAGYPGTREQSLALIRGEADVGSVTFESILDRIEAGDLRPILQISVEPIAAHPSLRNVPLLGGQDGLAARRAAALGRNAARIAAQARALCEMTGAGRLIVGPKGLDPALAGCLRETLRAVVSDPTFQATAGAAQRSLDYAPGDEAEASIAAAAGEASSFIPILRRSIEKLRQSPVEQ